MKERREVGKKGGREEGRKERREEREEGEREEVCVKGSEWGSTGCEERERERERETLVDEHATMTSS